MTPPVWSVLTAKDDQLGPQPGDIDLARRAVEQAHLMEGEYAEQQRSCQQQFLDLLSSTPDALERTSLPNHLTGSALVMRPSTGEFLVLWHNKLQRWLQPGGHADGDGNLAHVAWREATEETGIGGLAVLAPAIHLDVHDFRPREGAHHVHFDVRFLVIAPPDAEPRTNHESSGFRWTTVEELPDLGADPGLLALAEWGRHLLAELGHADQFTEWLS